MILELLLQYFLFSHISSLDYVNDVFNIPSIISVASLVDAQHLERQNNDLLSIDITAQAAIAVDALTGDVLYEKNSEDVRTIASITKLMTAMVFLDQHIDPTRVITLKEVDRHQGGMIHINIGEGITAKDLLYATLVGSDNDTAYALARISSESVEVFINEMNEKAKALGMNNTTFKDPTGLHNGNMSTAQDLTIMLHAALEYPEIRTATTLGMYEFKVDGLKDRQRGVKVYNTDKLVSSNYLEVIGGKTGYLESAGYCLLTKLKGQNNREIYVVVLGSETLSDRFQDTKAIEYFTSNAYQ